ncbi:ATP-binding cassette domain-containing protein [Nocardioides convexus]|uniref:ATP-binding cassette domain-containing protein n=1 Tax=Nocardioides convexus TaxID=2712224 RepID=UPI002418972A|nr:ATP-binding cassette domain-containing protein [Nocardioides convexus]
MALLGPNGAGKSTLVKVISGQKAATSGDLHLAGIHVKGAKSEEPGAGRAVHRPRGPLGLPEPHGGGEPAADVLRRRTGRGGAGDRVQPTSRGCTSGATRLAGTMSGGEQQMLAMSRALASDPALLLLDEPVDGPRPADRRGGSTRRSPGSPSPGSPSCASSSSPAPHCGSPTTPPS